MHAHRQVKSVAVAEPVEESGAVAPFRAVSGLVDSCTSLAESVDSVAGALVLSSCPLLTHQLLLLGQSPWWREQGWLPASLTPLETW
jgi:hypothetical protein